MIATMNAPRIPRPATVAPLPASPGPASLPAAFAEQLSDLYQLVARSSHVFGSPLGPLHYPGRALDLPRFVYFGPHSSDASLRLAFYAGFDHRDLRSTLALLHLVEGLALKPDLGQGLNLSFFPVVDILGLAGLAPARGDLGEENWTRTNAPEIRLLEQDARTLGYQGFIRIATAPSQDVVTVRLRAPGRVENPAPSLEWISSEDIEPFPVRWESDAPVNTLHGPLALADDLPQHPFELTLSLPAAWPTELVREAAASILKRFVLRYRGFISYGQHL
jgi:hypothetical protein